MGCGRHGTIPMTRSLLLIVAASLVFVALAAWIYFALTFLLWISVFGDDSTNFGYYAMVAALPTSSVLTWLYVRLANRQRFDVTALTVSIIGAVAAMSLFGICVA